METTQRTCCPRLRCARCGYDLRGTGQDSVCPECGMPVVLSKYAGQSYLRQLRLRWKHLTAALLTVLIVLIGSTGYVHVTEMWFCASCGRFEYRHYHDFHAPFVGSRLLRIPGDVSPLADSQVTPFLDVEGQCRHVLQPGASPSASGLLRGKTGMGPSPLIAPIADVADFKSFVAAHPEVVREIKARLRSGKPLKVWLYKKYARWKGWD